MKCRLLICPINVRIFRLFYCRPILHFQHGNCRFERLIVFGRQRSFYMKPLVVFNIHIFRELDQHAIDAGVGDAMNDAEAEDKQLFVTDRFPLKAKPSNSSVRSRNSPG